MASTGAPLNTFMLTPQQQSLLFAALNSNRPTNSPGNNPLTMSPASFNTSPLEQQGSGSGLLDSPSVDFDYEGNPDSSSLDFDFDGVDGGKMIGDLPGAPSTSSKDSDDKEISDKRSHPDDDEEQEEGSPKRHESGDKVPKKPGRKPLTSEPSSKRKAQNRAAQRAFRERKERHLKDLETKVEELEKTSQNANHENSRLRSQMEKMTVELNEYKKRFSLMTSNNRPSAPSRPTMFGHSIINNLNDVNFQFEFPKFGTLPGPAGTNGNTSSTTTRSSSVHSKSASPAAARSSRENSKDNVSPKTSTSQESQTSQTKKENLAKLSAIFSPPLTNGNVASASRSSLDSHFSVAGTSMGSPSASSGSNGGPSSSCGTSPEPYTQSPISFKPVDTLATIGEEQPSLTSNQDFGHFASIDMNDINWLASQNNFQFDPQLFGDYRESQESVIAANPTFDDGSFFNDAFDVDFTTQYNMPTNLPSPEKAAGDKRPVNLIEQIDAAKDGDDDGERIGSNGQLLTCNKIWERLQNCEKVQNGDFDLDGLCAELQKKAKCSGSGAVVEESEFHSVMRKYLGKTDEEIARCSMGKA